MKSSLTRLAVMMMLLASTQTGALEIITNPLNTTHSLSISSLRSIFSMRMTQWPDGTPIRVFVLRDKAPLHAKFTKQVLGVFPHQLRRAWNRQIYSGTGQAPVQLDTEHEMHNMVKATPGAIGYMTENQGNENIRIIEIE